MFPIESGCAKHPDDCVIWRLVVLDVSVGHMKKNPFLRANPQLLQQLICLLIESLREKAYFGGPPDTLSLPPDEAR
jgi:hypothetical protein